MSFLAAGHYSRGLLTNMRPARIVNMMVNYSPDTLNRTFSAVAHPTRRAILARLAQGEATVKELATPFKISLPAISRHLRILEQAGLMRRRKKGRTHYCHLDALPLNDVAG